MSTNQPGYVHRLLEMSKGQDSFLRDVKQAKLACKPSWLGLLKGLLFSTLVMFIKEFGLALQVYNNKECKFFVQYNIINLK